VHDGGWETVRLATSYPLVEVAGMVVRLRRVAIVMAMAGLVLLTAACTPGGGGGAATPGTGGSAAPQSQAAPGGY
jgi:hypothetical protein